MPYVEYGEENEKGVDDEGEDVSKGCKSEGHLHQQEGGGRTLKKKNKESRWWEPQWSAVVVASAAPPPLLSTSHRWVWLSLGRSEQK